MTTKELTRPPGALREIATDGDGGQANEARAAQTNAQLPRNGAQRPGPSLADMRAGLIVFLVAVPLCLGVATASGAPPLAGLIAGMVGGIVVALASGSELSVAGPAAGLTVIVLGGIESVGFPSFLLAVVLAGALQVLLGTLRLGTLAQLVPNAVVRGMLAAIGLILVLKQIPHAVGYDADYEGDTAFVQPDGRNTFSELLFALRALHPGAVLVAVSAGFAMLLWRDYGRLQLKRIIPRELVAVLVGLVVSQLLTGSSWALSAEHLVTIPTASGANGLSDLWVVPDLSAFGNPLMWKLAMTIAIVASIESLLSVEATDRLDPQRRKTPLNRELVAQGLGNMTSGALGGLPVTAVVVRSFANVQAGARSRWSAVFHGSLLLVATLALASVLNRIPLAALALVLLVVGYKLTPPKLYREMWQLGREQLIPFMVTVLAILFTDLLTGTMLGMGFAIFFVLYRQAAHAVTVTDDGGQRFVRFASDITFLQKGRLRRAVETMPQGGTLVLDGSRTTSISPEILEYLRELESERDAHAFQLSVVRSVSAAHEYFRPEATS